MMSPILAVNIQMMESSPFFEVNILMKHPERCLRIKNNLLSGVVLLK